MEINFCSTKLIFVHCQLKACLLDAFESFSHVGNEVISIIGCDADVVHILGTLIRFNNLSRFSLMLENADSARTRPKLDQQILGTRRFTKMSTDLSCAPSKQFHLGTDVRYHYVPKCTVFHVYLKIVVHQKEIASSNSLQRRRNWHQLRWWDAI